MKFKGWKKWVAGVLSAALLVTGAGIYEAKSYETTGTEQVNAGGESVYTDGTSLKKVTEIASPDGNIVVKLWSDKSKGRYFYSVSNKGECVIYASQLGLITSDADFTTGAEYVPGEVKQVTDTYTLLNGKHDGELADTCNAYAFKLQVSKEELTVTIRVYDDGMAYSYSMDHGATITGEASESVFADEALLWSYTQANVTYEGTYTKSVMNSLYSRNASFTVPSLIQTGNSWVLLTEASVFDDAESYCSSYLKTVANSKNLKWKFGNKQAGKVVMENAFETPWRVAVVGSDLNTIANTDIVTSVCEDAADIDYSWVKPGKLAWSWWSSTGDDPIAFEPQFAYIDFAEKNGWEYVCLDYGWVLWEDYKEKVEELVDYAAKKGVGIWLWYGVNDSGHAAAGAYPKYSLRNEETIRTEMKWAESIGIKGVKVDYYESDNQATMEQMYLCAKIAAEHKQMVLFHGCTNPGGENRTFPNVLSYEAIYGAEYYKWRTEPSTANVITYLFTRNAVGSADFTPTALPVAGISATHGFMLATASYIESGLIHFAENVNVYEGYKGLSLMNDMPCTWDETVVLEGYPGEYGSVARRSGDEWYIASLTVAARTTDMKLRFLEDGKTYTAYIYKTNAAGDDIEIVTQEVTSKDTLALDLIRNDGASVKLTTSKFDYETDYEKNYVYLEAEDAVLEGAAKLSTNAFNAQYASGKATAEYIGSGAENRITYQVNVPESGVYEVNVYYISANDRRFMISVNGDNANRIRTAPLNSGDWVTVEKETLYLALEKGTNTIQFYNDTVYAPNLDRISVSKAAVNKAATVSDETEDVVEVSPGEKYEYTVYEAEDGTIANGATKEGTLVGWLGGGSTLLLDTIEVTEAGKYYLRISYLTGEDRKVAVSVNGGENIFVDCPSSGDYYSNPAFAYVEVELKAGVNTIQLSNPSGYAPNIDHVGVATSVVVEEPEIEEETESVEVTEAKDTDDEQQDASGQDNVFKIIMIVIIAAAICGGIVCFVMKKRNKNVQ